MNFRVTSSDHFEFVFKVKMGNGNDISIDKMDKSSIPGFYVPDSITCIWVL